MKVIFPFNEMNDQSVYWNNGETRLLFTTWFGVKQAAMRNIEEISIFLLTFSSKKEIFYFKL